jgi:transporter family protein
MAGWFWYALVAAILYGAHQIFTKLASDRISDGLGGFVVEASAAVTILLYLLYLRFSGRWNQTASMPGINYSILTGLCVGAGTVVFFLLFQKGGPLSAVPAIGSYEDKEPTSSSGGECGTGLQFRRPGGRT